MPKHLGQANTGMCCVDISVPRRSAVVASAPGRSTVVVTCSSRRGTHCHIVATKGSAYYRSTGRRLVATIVLSSSPVLVAVTTTAAPSAMFVPATDNEPLPLCVDTGVQAEGEYDPRSRVRRVILAGLEALPLRFVHPNGVEGVRDELLPQHAPDRVRTNEQRRMCDCTTCVRHATELMSSDQFAEVPPTPGIRLTPLPGLGLTHCPKGAATVLAKGLQESRKKTLIVCACSTCSAHRGLLWAYHHVQKVRRTPRSPLAGTPPKRRRVCNDPRH